MTFLIGFVWQNEGDISPNILSHVVEKSVLKKPNNSICLTYYKSPRSEKKIFSFRPFVSFTFDGQKRRLGSWASWTGTWTSTAKRKVILKFHTLLVTLLLSNDQSQNFMNAQRGYRYDFYVNFCNDDERKQ